MPTVPLKMPREWWFSAKVCVSYSPGCARILSKWTIIDRLSSIKIPTLIINGRFDIAQEKIVKPFADNIPNSKWRIFENSSHTPFWEEREEYMQVVGEFLAGQGSS